MALFSWQSSRRKFLAGGTLLSALAGTRASRLLAFAGVSKGPAKPQNLYDRLGVRTRINAKGTYTYLTGSLLAPEVARALEEASHHYVYIVELQQKVGEKIAEMLGVEAALVTSGAAGAIMLGTAATLTGKDEEKIKRLPDLTGMKSEVIIQKTHRTGFDHAIRNCGVRLVEVETAGELESAISDKTAMLYFLNAGQHRGKIGLEQWVEAGKRHSIPTFNDAAADVPPVSHLSDYNKMGFDMVAFSGGKGLLGPQCAGLLLGRKDLIEAAMLNNNPNEDTIGRPCKVGKEEILAMFVAVERYVKLDHDAEWKDWERRIGVMEKILSSLPGIHTGRFVPDVANHVPHLYAQWDESALGLSKAQCAQQLREGEPSIEALEDDYPYGLSVTPFMMKPGEELIVARRMKAVFLAAQKKAKA
jgi:D-glucosaminate-6-phosphate ammonia-lyase